MAAGSVIIKPNIRSNLFVDLMNPTDIIDEIAVVAITHKYRNGNVVETPVNIGFWKDGRLRENAHGLRGMVQRQTGNINIESATPIITELTVVVNTVNLNKSTTTNKLDKLECILDRVDDMLASRSEGNRGSAAVHEDLLYREINEFINTHGESPLEFVKALRRKKSL